MMKKFTLTSVISVLLMTACGVTTNYATPTQSTPNVTCVTCDTATAACKRLYGSQYVASSAGGCVISPYEPAD
jgi:hypothetical protein